MIDDRALRQTQIEPFKESDSNLSFKGAHVFSYKNKHLLIEDHGHIIIVDDSILDSLKNKRINDDLGIKLIQRNFACYQSDFSGGLDERDDNFDIKPIFFMIDLTQNCNMGCRYCLRENGHVNKTMTEDKLDDICDYICDYCNQMDVDIITVQPWGGEPLLEYEKILRIRDRFSQKGISPCISIETNGTLLNEEIINKLYERHIFINVSIDGTEEVHDKQRVLLNGAATHKTVADNIKLLQKKYGDQVSVITTITKNSIPYIEDILEYLAKELKLKSIKVNFVHKSDFVDNDELCLSEKEISDCTLRIFDEIIKLNENGYQIYEYNILTKLMNILAHKKNDICISRGCNGGKKMITFGFEGDIYPCDVTDYPEEKLGNIYDGRSLIQMVSEAEKSHDYFIEKSADSCKSCPWKFFCRGGCTVRVKCNGLEPPCIDSIECANNWALYPRLIELILKKPDLVNKLVDFSVL